MRVPALGLPVEEVLPALRSALRTGSAAVLVAPPGAGKTTLVPLALLPEEWLRGQRLVMLEPRRLAARAAAERMASLLNETVGETVGYRMRDETRVGPRTAIEVVTEGILMRFLHADASLPGIGAVIFDEFHERSLHADIGLAFALETQRIVRPDLRLIAMSATLDGARVAALMGHAPIVASEGRLFPVDVRHVPPAARLHQTATVVRTVDLALAEHPGDLLVFLPGAREIHQVQRALDAATLPPGVFVMPLHGTLTLADQRRAILPAPAGQRKVVLATTIAETSLTIEGVRVVIDSGLARVPRYSPRTGMTRLETVRVSRASAEQRAGRAGRMAPGWCYRLWDAHDTATLRPFGTPEILEADLTSLALDLALMGTTDATQLAWLDAPPSSGLARARELLRELDALDSAFRVTPHGHSLARLGTHPRLAHLLVRARELGPAAVSAACDLAAVLEERDLLRGEGAPPPADLAERLALLRDRPRTTTPTVDRAHLQRVRAQAERWRRRLEVRDVPYEEAMVGSLVALAFPDRVALRREGDAPRYLLRDGVGALLPPGDTLSHHTWLAIAETDGAAPEARVVTAAALERTDVERLFAGQVVARRRVEWDWDSFTVRAEEEQVLGTIVMRSTRATPTADELRAALERAIAQRGLAVLPWSDAARDVRARLAFLHHHDDAWPDVSDAALLGQLDGWLGPELGHVRHRRDLGQLNLVTALDSLLDWRQRATFAALAPTHVTVPTGSALRVDYSDPSAPVLAVRLQEMFGCRETPRIFGGRVPLTLHLLSPAQRPVQVTQDLAGFWRDAYFDVRKDLRGRYPKHEWPDDPLTATPTRRAKRRT